MFRRHLDRVLAAALAGCVAGCTAGGMSGGTLSSAHPPTIAFETIDGPPPEVFRKLVATLDQEAQARQVAVVSRKGQANYRVRGYVTAQIERGRTSFAWVWDVYDNDKKRTLRVAGEEPAGAGSRGNAWAAADEAVLRQMARKGMDRIATFLNASAPPALEPTEPNTYAVASARDDSPEAAGIFRPMSADSSDAGAAAEPAATDIPVPRKKPRQSKPPAAIAGTPPEGTVAQAPRN